MTDDRRAESKRPISVVAAARSLNISVERHWSRSMIALIALLAAVVTVGLATMIYVALKSHLDALAQDEWK